MHQPMADRVEPIPEEILPQDIRQSAAATSLFKEEFRAAQRLRSTEGVFIPEVVRTTHPPDQGPHGVASHPAPTYSKAPADRPSTAQKRAVGPGQFSQANTKARPGSSRPGFGNHWSDAQVWSEHLNSPGKDYLLTRPPSPGSSSRRPSSPTRVVASPPPLKGSTTGKGGHRPTSSLAASLKSRLTSARAGGPPAAAGAAPKTSLASKPLKPSGGSTAPVSAMAGITRMEAARQEAAGLSSSAPRPSPSSPSTALSRTAPQPSPSSPSPHAAPPAGHSTITAAARKGALSHLPPRSTPTPTHGADAGDGFVQEVEEDEEGLVGEPKSRPASALPVPRAGGLLSGGVKAPAAR